MTTYVLVHGAWSGAHSFHLVRPLLAERGHVVTSPSLTGLGERGHLVSPLVGLSTHVRDVVAHVVYEDLRDVVLVGHSYGGCVVTGALDALADRLTHVVYLDAFVPRDGESVLDLLGRSADDPTGPGGGLGGEWLLPPPTRDFDDPAEGAWAAARRLPHPARCFSEPVRLRRPLEEQPVGLTYVKAAADPRTVMGGEAFWAAAERARDSSRWAYAELDTGHMVQHNRPRELADLLLALAR